MTVLAWTLIFLAILIQLMNVILVLRAKAGGGSQLLLVPCVLWYIALVVRGEAFFVPPKGLEIAVVVIVHLLLTVTVPRIVRACRRTTDGPK